MPKGNWGSGVSGGVSGAAAGSVFGPWGTAIGGTIGLLGGLFSGGKKGSNKNNGDNGTIEGQKVKSPKGMGAYNKDSVSMLIDLLQNGGLANNSIYGPGNEYIQKLLSGDQSAFDAFEEPYKEQFEQQVIPGIAERFAGMGTGAGALNSSALYNSLAQAGKGLSTNLAALRGQLQMQALPQALAYAQQPIQNQLTAAGLIPGQYYEKPKKQGFLGGLLGGLGGLDLSSLSNLFGDNGEASEKGYEAQFPLTNSYDQQFRVGGVPGA